MSLCLIPIPELPGFELPRRERLHPPLRPPSRGPVAETRSLLDLGLHRARHGPAPGLARRRADHIDEFRLIGHGSLLAKHLASARPKLAPNCLTTSFDNGSRLREGRFSFLLMGFLYANRYPLRSKTLYRHSLISTKCPAIAAAAAIAGDTRWVRPLNPWRPSKLRFEVEAQRSSGFSLSGFIARHIEQPGSRHSNPALMKILSRPSASACSFTMPEPGTIMALRLPLTVLPATTFAAARRSSIRPLVQEPMKIRSSLMSVILVPGFRPI